MKLHTHTFETSSDYPIRNGNDRATSTKYSFVKDNIAKNIWFNFTMNFTGNLSLSIAFPTHAVYWCTHVFTRHLGHSSHFRRCLFVCTWVHIASAEIKVIAWPFEKWTRRSWMKLERKHVNADIRPHTIMIRDKRKDFCHYINCRLVVVNLFWFK